MGALSIILPFFRTKAGMLLLVFAALFSWHKLDKHSAVRKAVVSYVADVELGAANARVRELQAQLKRTAAANMQLAERIEQSEQGGRDAIIDSALGALPKIDGCVITDDLIDLLR
jgi:glucose-6-phosphate-specific signal transduction histidine kinase